MAPGPGAPEVRILPAGASRRSAGCGDVGRIAVDDVERGGGIGGVAAVIRRDHADAACERARVLRGQRFAIARQRRGKGGAADRARWRRWKSSSDLYFVRSMCGGPAAALQQLYVVAGLRGALRERPVSHHLRRLSLHQRHLRHLVNRRHHRAESRLLFFRDPARDGALERVDERLHLLGDAAAVRGEVEEERAAVVGVGAAVEEAALFEAVENRRRRRAAQAEHRDHLGDRAGRVAAQVAENVPFLRGQAGALHAALEVDAHLAGGFVDRREKAERLRHLDEYTTKPYYSTSKWRTA